MESVPLLSRARVLYFCTPYYYCAKKRGDWNPVSTGSFGVYSMKKTVNRQKVSVTRIKCSK
jgi:hypothetical protein